MPVAGIPYQVLIPRLIGSLGLFCWFPVNKESPSGVQPDCQKEHSPKWAAGDKLEERPGNADPNRCDSSPQWLEEGVVQVKDLHRSGSHSINMYVASLFSGNPGYRTCLPVSILSRLAIILHLRKTTIPTNRSNGLHRVAADVPERFARLDAATGTHPLPAQYFARLLRPSGCT